MNLVKLKKEAEMMYINGMSENRIVEFVNSKEDSSNANEVLLVVNNGMALVKNDNFTNDHYQNSQSGIEETIIPATISYNG
jgi:hypothetical protein